MNRLLFSPVAFNLAETTRMLEIARACRDDFECHFMTHGGQFEHLIEEAGFTLHSIDPILTPEKIEHIYKVDKGEKLARMFNEKEAAERVASEVSFLQKMMPAAVITGFNLTLTVSARVTHTPQVWVIQSTWMKETGMGLLGPDTGGPLRPLLVELIAAAANLVGGYAAYSSSNRVARRYGVEPIRSLDDLWKGNETLLAEPPGFFGFEQLPPHYHYIGPLIAREDFAIPDEVLSLPRDKPLIYFAMGSSGTPEIIANILQGFADTPYQVIAPVKKHLEKLDVHIPENVLVTDWLPAHKVNPMADISVIHGGIGTVMTAAMAGKPVVGVGMQPEQDANLDCLVRQGFAIRIPKRKANGERVVAAVEKLLHDEQARIKASQFSEIFKEWDGPTKAAAFLKEHYGGQTT